MEYRTNVLEEKGVCYFWLKYNMGTDEPVTLVSPSPHRWMSIGDYWQSSCEENRGVGGSELLQNYENEYKNQYKQLK